MRYRTLLIFGLIVMIIIGHEQVSATLAMDNKDDNATSSAAKFSETDTYIDINTGKSFKVIYDGLNEVYNRNDLSSFDFYVNTRTKDTMWSEDAILVNNALIHGAEGKYRLDPMKVKRDGNSFKVKAGVATPHSPAPLPGH